ncbi:MAG: phosphoheptose isomerase [Gammaproteobacteria bacterium]
MDTIEHIKSLFKASIEAKADAADSMPSSIATAAEIIVHSLLENHKLLICGNGGSAADAQHFAAELINRFEIERPSLPAIALTTDSSALTAIANDYQYTQIFAKQVAGLGQAGDILIAISTSGNSENIIAAIQTAQQKHMPIVALTGKNGGQISGLLTTQDIELRVPSETTARIQEVHIFILHALCDLIDKQLFGY